MRTYLLSLTIILVVTLSTVLSLVQADRQDHSDHTNDHEGGSQGGNEDPISKFYESCNTGKASCVGAVKDGSKKPADCYKSKNCDYMVAITKEDKRYRFSLFGKPDKTAGYVGVGISKDGKGMAKSSIVECRASSPTDLHIAVTWAETATTPQQLGEDESKYIQIIEEPHVFNGKIICEFYRDAKSNVKGYDFDLDDHKYKILLAVGGTKPNGAIDYHGPNRVLSDYMDLKSANASPKNMVPSTFLLLLSAYVAWCW